MAGKERTNMAPTLSAASGVEVTVATPRLLYDIPSALVGLGGMSRSVFYELVKNGEIRTLKIGRRTYVAHDELERYVRRLTEKEAVSPR
jgi:excisionase family DNA binding protein